MPGASTRVGFMNVKPTLDKCKLARHRGVGRRTPRPVSSWLYLALAFVPAAGAAAEWLPGWMSAVTPPLAFAATHWLIPTVRPIRQPLISPKSILYAGFAIQLVAAPLLFLIVGPVLWVFPVPQTWGAVATAALLIALTFPCWALGLVAFERTSTFTEPSTGLGSVPRWMIVLFAALGAAGLALFALQASGLQVRPGADGVETVLRLVMRPFLAAAAIAALSNLFLARGASLDRWQMLVALSGCVVLVALSAVTVDVRRGPLLASMLALLAAYGLVTARPSMRTLVTMGVGASLAFLAVRVLRSPEQPFNTLFNSSGADEGLLSAFNTEVQSYAGGLQMVAFLLDHAEALGGFLHGRGQIYTAIAPIPELGASVRDSTPGALYNALFINRQDQVLPLAGQLYLDFGVVAVVIGCMLLGMATGLLHRLFMRSPTLIEAYVWVLPSTWLAFSLGSSPIGFYQSLIYFSLPSYFLIAFGARGVQARRSLAAPP